MSRVPSEIPKPLKNLPRRAVLKGAVASPLALAVAAGQVSAGSLDPRLAVVDRMIAEIERTDKAQNVASHTQGAENDDGENVFDVENAKWYAAREVLEAYGLELAERQSRSVGDAVVLAKIADFWFVTDEDDFSEVDEYFPTVRAAVTAFLRAATVPLYRRPTWAQAERDGLEKSAAARSEEPRRPPHYNAGLAIARIRSIGGAVRAALTHECHLRDGTLKMHKAMAVTNRRYAELDALSAELCAGKPPGVDVSNWLDGPYIWGQREDFVIWGELILAYRDDLLTAPLDEPASLLLQKLLGRAREIGDELVIAAERHRSLGGANV